MRKIFIIIDQYDIIEKNEHGEPVMSEQMIQEGLYSIPVQLDKYVCRSLGATTIKDLVKSKEIKKNLIQKITELTNIVVV